MKENSIRKSIRDALAVSIVLTGIMLLVLPRIALGEEIGVRQLDSRDRMEYIETYGINTEPVTGEGAGTEDPASEAGDTGESSVDPGSRLDHLQFPPVVSSPPGDNSTSTPGDDSTSTPGDDSTSTPGDDSTSTPSGGDTTTTPGGETTSDGDETVTSKKPTKKKVVRNRLAYTGGSTNAFVAAGLIMCLTGAALIGRRLAATTKK